MNYNVFSGTLNPTQSIKQSINQSTRRHISHSALHAPAVYCYCMSITNIRKK